MPLPPLSTQFAQTAPGCGVPWPPAPVPKPSLLHWNAALAAELALNPDPQDDLAALFSGNAALPGSRPVAQAYAGHQFGRFTPSLGDGRALLLGEWTDVHGARRDVALKGSGRTPFSRGGDGKAAVGPMLRELLIGEALHALGVPTTRALAVVATGEVVSREQALPGAVLTRVAASHLRVGSFQYLAARDDRFNLQALLDHAIDRHAPALRGHPQPALAMLREVALRQARLVAQWMNLGFIHGVMNTDNMTISGESIDFGPCAFLEHYDPTTHFSSIDSQGRYAYANQPHIARWNLARLAEALLPLMADADGPQGPIDQAVAEVTEVIDAFPDWYDAALREGQRRKLGLAQADAALADEWLALLQQGEADFTLAWRYLAGAREGQAAALHGLMTDSSGLAPWLARWRAAGPAGSDALDAVNPLVLPRNHTVEAALAAASQEGDLRPTEALLAALREPYAPAPPHSARAPYAEPAPRAFSATYRTFCGT